MSDNEKKLKTLKDINPLGVCVAIGGEDTDNDENLVIRNDLRQEAKKWIKYMEKLCDETNKKSKNKGTLQFTVPIEWIKHFFNLEE